MRVLIALLGLMSTVAAAQTKESETAMQLLDAVTEGLERSQGISRKTETLVAKGSEVHLAGNSSLDESVVGSCFDPSLRPVAARMPGDPKGRDVDEQRITARLISSAEEKDFNASIFALFGVSEQQRDENVYFLVSHQVVTKNWKTPNVMPLEVAPRDTAYCAVEATEGRTVDVLFSSSSKRSATGASLAEELRTFVPQMSMRFSEVKEKFNMNYDVRVRGYRSKDASLPDYESLQAVLGAVEPGAPLIWDVSLVATQDQIRKFKERVSKAEHAFIVYDKGSSTVRIDTVGKLQIDVASSVGVSLRFSPGSTCRPSAESTQHSIACTSTQPIIVTVTNPAAFGLGSAADVRMTVTSTVER